MKIKNIVLWMLLLSQIPLFDQFQIQNYQDQSNNYHLGVHESQVITYKITDFDAGLASEYLGFSQIYVYLGRYAYVGAYRFIRIESIKEVNNLQSLYDNQNCSGWLLNVSSWDWVTSYDWQERQGDPDIIYENLEIYENPLDLGEDFYNIEEMNDNEKFVLDYLNFPYFCPLPINNYLGEIQWADNWIINSTKISIKYNESTGKSVEKTHTFANNGLLKKTQMLTEDGRIIYTYILENENMPVFILTLFLIVASLFILGLGYVILRKSKLNIGSKRTEIS